MLNNDIYAGRVVDEMRTRPLSGLFSPRSIAIIGASDRNIYSRLAKGNLDRAGFSGKLYAVNRDGKPALGLPISTLAYFIEFGYF